MKKLIKFLQLDFQKVIFFLILIIFPFGQLSRLTFENLPGITFQMIDFLVFFFVFLWLWRKIVLKKNTGFPVCFKEFIVFLAIVVFSLIINFSEFGFSLASVLYFLRLTNLFLFYFSVKDFFSRQTEIKVLPYLFLEGVFISLVSISQYILLPDTRFLFNLGWDMHYFRAIGPFLDPAFTALICVFSFFVFVDILQNSQKFKKIDFRTILFFAGGLLIFVSIAISFSRMAYFLLFLGLLFLIKKKLLKFLLILLLFIGVVALLPKPTGEGVDLLRKSSFLNRFDNYKNTLTIIGDNLIFGVGFNNFRLAQLKYGFLNITDWQQTHSGAGADNSFLLVLATTGIFGLASYLYLWFGIVKEVLRFEKNWKKLLIATTATLIVSAFFVNSLFYPWIMVWYFLLLAKFTTEEQK